MLKDAPIIILDEATSSVDPENEDELQRAIAVSYTHLDVYKRQLYDTAKTVGSVFQNPRSQFFNVDTTSEITFGCEMCIRDRVWTV